MIVLLNGTASVIGRAPTPQDLEFVAMVKHLGRFWNAK